MTVTVDHFAASAATDGVGSINERVEEPYLRADDYDLTARQVVFALADRMARFGDTLSVTLVDPLTAIDAHMRFGGDLAGWTVGRSPADVATVLARAAQIARDYFGNRFPPIPW